MKVYLVMHHIDYEGLEVDEIYLDRERAEAQALAMMMARTRLYHDYYVEERDVIK